MKDSWLLYSYLQHWWRLLLFCCALGILGAYLVNEPTVYAKAYSATGTAAILDQAFEYSPMQGSFRQPEFLVTLTSGPKSNRQEAVAALEAKFSQLSEYVGTLVGRRDTVIQENSQGTWAWWKGITLGGVIGLLAAIGMIYIWTDVQAFQKREQAAQSQYQQSLGGQPQVARLSTDLHAVAIRRSTSLS